MQLKTPRLVLSILQWLVYGICVADGICIVRDLTFLGKIGGNLMTGLFFVILALRLWWVWRERDRHGMIRLRNYALGVLCLSLLFLTVWLLLWSSNRLVYEAALYLLILVSAPLPSWFRFVPACAGLGPSPGQRVDRQPEVEERIP